MWHISPAQRLANAKKAAATRKARGEKPFGGKHGKGGFHLTPQQRIDAARKAAATRKARRG
jgi:hypothetical protein